MNKSEVSFKVNGQPHRVEVFPMARLLDVLRQDLQLTGTKEGCGEGECGACSVIIDGRIVNSCLVPVVQVAGSEITTIEGVANDEQLHAVQQAFIDQGGAQCGICTPGMFMAALGLPESASLEEIKLALAGNICRCTGYEAIYRAIQDQ